MTRTVTKKYKPNRSVSKVDQRLAAMLHQRQIETIIRSEVISDRTARVFNIAVEDAIAALRYKRDAPAVMRRAAEVMKHEMLNGFADLARWSHEELIDGYYQSIPINWLKTLLPPETAFAFEDERDIIGNGSGLDIETPSEPIAIDPDLTDEEKRELIGKLIFPPPSSAEVAAIVSSPDANTGTKWEDRFSALSKKITDNEGAFKAIVDGFSDGDNVAAIRKRLLPIVGGIKASAQRIARTEGLRVAERIQRRSWDELGDMMSGVQILAVLDENTRPHHSSRNGKIYYRNPSAGQLSMTELPDLPDELNCRCWSNPVLQPPESLEKDPAVQKAFKSASGAGIPEPASYDRWFSQVDVGRRKMAVGSGRYNEVSRQLTRIREPEWTDFIGDDGKLMSIKELKSESSYERQARKERLKKRISDQGSDITSVRDRGFRTRKVSPTLVSGQTFSREVDPTSNASLIGEVVRTRVAKGVLNEVDVRSVGQTIRNYINTDDVKRLALRQSRIQSRMEYYRGRKRLTDDESRQERELANLYIQHRDEIVRVKQERYLEVMSSIRDMGSGRAQPVKPGSNKDVERLTNESQRFFPSDWLNKFHESPIRNSLVSRGYFTPDEIAVSDSGIAGRRSTMVHEMFHRAEHLIEGVRKTEKEIYRRRTKGSKKRPIHFSKHYRIKEYCRRNRWLGSKANGSGEYMGKHYDSGYYEIGTMGMEGIIFGTYPIENDLEVYDLVLGILASF